MLIHIKCFGGGLNATLYLEVSIDDTVGDLIDLVKKIRPDIEVKRLLFAGKQLKDRNAPLSKNGTSLDRKIP